MTKKILTSLTHVFIIAVTFFTAPTFAAPPAPSLESDTDDRPVIQLEHKGPVKVVYQVSEDKWKDGVGKAFLYLKNLRGYYAKQGIEGDQLDIHAVVHGDAATHVLTDEAYNRVKGVDTGNPNTKLLSELKEMGIQVELCDVRRQREGWSKSDIHGDVQLAAAAYARIIDLQLQGYAYIKF
ncbi:DsrE family protein [Aporhodopirellula aestuarii]|uniref:DsrE family protein n=1 Tax=Aporhodopirellula aestuarii TaxID=2950107 RepID=A0ABT0TZZ4_9BACT|nr:DsrE family protein [Aporhodopirellula aestuarii]MCM2370152.1 DsrE family protein [Aporhodopirellula aestuarii]